MRLCGRLAALKEGESSHVAFACSLPHSGVQSSAVAGVGVVVGKLCAEVMAKRK